MLHPTNDPSQEVALSLQPGESVLLQGAHVKHQANQSRLGCRVSLVVSLAPASVLLPDTTRVRFGLARRCAFSGRIDTTPLRDRSSLYPHIYMYTHTPFTPPQIRYHALPLAEDEAYFRAAVAYREARVRELVAKHPQRRDRWVCLGRGGVGVMIDGWLIVPWHIIMGWVIGCSTSSRAGSCSSTARRLGTRR